MLGTRNLFPIRRDESPTSAVVSSQETMDVRLEKPFRVEDCRGPKPWPEPSSLQRRGVVALLVEDELGRSRNSAGKPTEPGMPKHPQFIDPSGGGRG